MARAGQRLVALGALAACALAAGGCGSHPATPAGRTAALRVTEQDFRISAPAVVPTGDVVVTVRNDGPDDHALGIVKAPGVGNLPMRKDGVTVDFDAIAKRTVGGVPPSPAGTVTKLRLHLDPGRYILLCNMSGHYLGGMDAELVVR
jgi:hypothetical protein